MRRRALLASTEVGNLFPIFLNSDNPISLDLFNKLWDYIYEKGECLSEAFQNYIYVLTNEEMVITHGALELDINTCETLLYNNLRSLTFYLNADLGHPYFVITENNLVISFQD